MIPPRTLSRTALAALGAGLLLGTAGCADRPPPLPAPMVQGGCPSWVAFPADRHSNADSPSLGCASNANLRAMLEDPADLERGRPFGPADAARETLAIEAYQQGKIAGASGSSTGGSTGSTPATSPGSGGGSIQ
jgi:hypothetical protein